MIYEVLKELLNSMTLSNLTVSKKPEIIPEGYNHEIDNIRSREYSHLQDEVYLDNAGLPVIAKYVIDKASEILLKTVYGNPHSQSAVSQQTENLIERTRLEILKLFNLSYMTHEVIFTQNATLAIKLLGEGFSDTFEEFNFVYNEDSHTSILGLREKAKSFETFKEPNIISQKEIPTLVAWLAQSNFDGKRYPIEEWNHSFKEDNKTYTLLDSSSLCCTSFPDLGNMISVPDFICVSLYKIFGYPDLGCLIVNKKSAEEVFCKKKYFGGGTVEAVNVDGYVEKRRELVSRLEEGTLPIHSIIQLSLVIPAFKDVYGSFKLISMHVKSVTEYAISHLKKLCHDNGEPMVDLFISLGQGPIVTFCLVDKNGNRLGYNDFEKYASARKISLRTGALCNAGALCNSLDLTTEDLKSSYSRGHRCGDGQDMIDGKVKGVIRVSFGAMTNISDIEMLCSCIEEFFTETFSIGFSHTKHSELTLKSVTIYPIKSCAGYSIGANKPWNITASGLEYDRLFCLLDPSTKSPLLLKNNPQMTFIRPRIDPFKRMMTLTYKEKSIEVSIQDDISSYHKTVHVTNDKLTYECVVDPEVMTFFSDIISVPCLLAKPILSQSMHNKSDFLVLSNSSLNYLENYDKDQLQKESLSRFRGNLVVQGKDLKPFEEDNWNYIEINGLVLKNSELCERCHMITIDLETGKRDNRAFVNLSKFRKIGGKILFGINCDIDGKSKNLQQLQLKVGDKISIS